MSISKHLEYLEQELQRKEFVSHGSFEKGVLDVIVCLPRTTPKINGISIQNIIRDKQLPFSIIWIDDLTESRQTCRRVSKLVESQIQNCVAKGLAVVNIIWARLIEPLESSPTIIIGKRFFLIDKKRKKQLTNGLADLGVRVFEDFGEYGGGPLVYSLLEILKHSGNSLLVELTLSHSVASDASILDGFFRLLSTL
jgi:hypothetical protein